MENGDINWMLPNKFVAFSGPHSRSRVDHGIHGNASIEGSVEALGGATVAGEILTTKALSVLLKVVSA